MMSRADLMMLPMRCAVVGAGLWVVLRVRGI